MSRLSGGSAARLRVLVAATSEETRATAAAVLAELGQDVALAADGAEAWRTIEEWRPDLVVLGVELPIVDGLEVCRRIHERDDGQPPFVLFLTARAQPEVLEAILDAGGDEFVATPMVAADFRARLIVTRRRIALEAARRAAEQELAEARWLAGIGEATLSIQHEINNPLSALLGHAELLLMELREKGERNELAEVMHEQALRIADVVRRLRQLKNPESVDYVGGSRMVDLSRNAIG